MIWNEDVPVIKERDQNGKEITIKIVAGNYSSNKAIAPPPDSWAAIEDHDVAIWVITLEAGANWKLPSTDKDTNRNLYFFEGESIVMAKEEIPSYKGVVLDPSYDIEIQNGPKPSRLLLLQGKPINEPVVQQGPFVMNYAAEIRQTMLDYQKDQFGGWPWPSSENVHPKEYGRFARYVDGKEEFK
jgi:redox-sensitive bicupin YhaK (pirin superfamily)